MLKTCKILTYFRVFLDRVFIQDEESASIRVSLVKHFT